MPRGIFIVEAFKKKPYNSCGMDFKTVLQKVVSKFSGENVRFGLIGGFGMAALGIARATMDMDFLLHRDDVAIVKKILGAYGYTRAFESENVIQFIADVNPMGAMDFLLAFRPISLGMLERVKWFSVFEGELTVPVLRPEDIIGLKVQAVANNPSRREQDITDIVILMQEFADVLDWSQVRAYFQMFDLNALFDDLSGRFG